MGCHSAPRSFHRLGRLGRAPHGQAALEAGHAATGAGLAPSGALQPFLVLESHRAAAPPPRHSPSPAVEVRSPPGVPHGSAALGARRLAPFEQSQRPEANAVPIEPRLGCRRRAPTRPAPWRVPFLRCRPSAPAPIQSPCRSLQQRAVEVHDSGLRSRPGTKTPTPNPASRHYRPSPRTGPHRPLRTGSPHPARPAPSRLHTALPPHRGPGLLLGGPGPLSQGLPLKEMAASVRHPALPPVPPAGPALLAGGHALLRIPREAAQASTRRRARREALGKQLAVRLRLGE